MLIPQTAVLSYDREVLTNAGELGKYVYSLLHDINKIYNDIGEAFNKLDQQITIMERTSDPTAPAEGEAIIWLSDGTGKGDDGDIMIASTAGGVTKYTTLFDHSAGSAW